MYVFGPDATDQIQLAWMLLITVAIVALAVCVVSVTKMFNRRLKRIEYQLREEGCDAYTTGKLSGPGGVLDRFHRAAHGAESGVPLQRK